MIEELLRRHSALQSCRTDLLSALRLLQETFAGGGKVLLCGNGGSAADCGHIVGELMKSFRAARPLPATLREALCREGAEGERLAERLQAGLPAIDLCAQVSLSTAFANDVDAGLVFAQQVAAYGRPGDLLWAMSTSGEAANVRFALRTARALGLRRLGLSGRTGGSMRELCDVCIRVPADATYEVQEFHLPVYHALCAALEKACFGEGR